MSKTSQTPDVQEMVGNRNLLEPLEKDCRLDFVKFACVGELANVSIPTISAKQLAQACLDLPSGGRFNNMFWVKRLDQRIGLFIPFDMAQAFFRIFSLLGGFPNVDLVASNLDCSSGLVSTKTIRIMMNKYIAMRDFSSGFGLTFSQGNQRFGMFLGRYPVQRLPGINRQAVDEAGRFNEMFSSIPANGTPEDWVEHFQRLRAEWHSNQVNPLPETTPRAPAAKRPEPKAPPVAVSWEDVLNGGSFEGLWTRINPDAAAVNLPVLDLPTRGTGIAPGPCDNTPATPSGPKAYEGVDAKDISYTAAKLVGVNTLMFEFFQRFASDARRTVLGESGWQFCFNPLSYADDAAVCFKVVAVGRVVRLFADADSATRWYDRSVKKAHKPSPLCYLVPADWEAAIRQVWALGQTVGSMGKHLPVPTH